MALETNFDHKTFLKEISIELQNIITYWKEYSIDEKHGGFVGKVNNDNCVFEKSPKSIILNSRILWTFSRVGNFHENHEYDAICLRAFNYLYDNFRDKKHGGVFWEVNFRGKPTNKRKQVYAHGFTIYALTEYYKLSKNKKALDWALEIYRLLEEKAVDSKYHGYIEAFDHAWNSIEDMRLSEKDVNAPKTANTHLHVLEAYTTLLEVTGSPEVENSLRNLLTIFTDVIFNPDGHMDLFFSRSWEKCSDEISFGHDIEAAWLLLRAAEVIHDGLLIAKLQKFLLKVTHRFIIVGLDWQYGVINSKNTKTGEIDPDKHWWPQAEAMIGLAYAWKITNTQSYLKACEKVWHFTKKNIIDHANGEWFFRVDSNGIPYTAENKIGPWKCPYHNSRALIEILDLTIAQPNILIE